MRNDLLVLILVVSLEYHWHDCCRMMREYAPAIYRGGVKAASVLWFRVPQKKEE